MTAPSALVAVVPHPAAPREAQPVDVALVLEQTGGVRGDVIHERAPGGPGDKYFGPVMGFSRDTAADVFVDHRARTYRKGPGEIQAAIADGRVTAPVPPGFTGVRRPAGFRPPGGR